MVPIRYNIRSLTVRKRTSAAAVFGIALVVFVTASSMMLSEGVQRTMARSGHADNAIVLRKGSDAELNSGIEEPQVGLVLAVPGVKKDAQNNPMGVGEVVVVTSLEKIGTNGGISNVQVRGVPDNAYAFRPEVKIISGRQFKPGTDECIIGRGIQGRFVGMTENGKFEIKKNRNLQVVGVFEAEGSSYESEVWADRDVVRTSFGREGIVSSISVRLESPTKFDGFETVIESDKQLGLEALREPEYFEKQSSGLATFVSVVGAVIAVFFSMGAMIGAMITMFAQVSNRSREIGTLRAIGFSRGAILFAFLLESTVLALLGGVVGTVASLGMGFVKFSMVNFASFSEIVFSFDPTPQIIITAVVFAAGMGIIGGFFPAVRAAQVSPVRAMRG